jgi:hypothetical protein
MRRGIEFFGFLILSAITASLFISVLQTKIALGLLPFAALQGALLVGLAVMCWKEGAAAWGPGRGRAEPFVPGDVADVLAVLAGAVGTYTLVLRWHLNPVVAACAIGLAASPARFRVAMPVYCGAFAGMSCPLYLCDYSFLALGAVVTGVLYVLCKPFFAGFGGKLGALAFAGSLYAGEVANSPLQSRPVPGWETGWMLLLYATAGALTTYLLSTQMRVSAVRASAGVGLAAGLLLPALHVHAGEEMALVVFSASFAGMSARTRFMHPVAMLVAGPICGIVYMHSHPTLGGAGGKLGAIAFGTVLAMRGVMALWARFRSRA